MEKRMSKMLAIIFALALGFAYSCGGGDGGSSGGAAGYTPDNAPATSGATSLSTTEKTEVEQYVTTYVSALAGAFSATSRKAETYSQCFNEPVGECSSAQYCVEATGSQTSGHVKVWMDEAMDCNGVNIYFWEYDVDYTYSGSDMNITSSAGAIDVEYDEGFGTNPLRIFVKWDKDGSVDGWIAENGVKTGEIGGTASDPTVTWL
ncbi:MAG: hypothetical protein NT056_07050 [Proteobacteria bacterium]|nr:hypothetical protein [Pseudomonadota bacterium]